MIKVSRVECKKDVDQFIRFFWDVYKKNPRWVPPIIQQLKPFLLGKSKFFDHCEYELFIATRNKKIVAVAGAFYDQNLIEHYHEPIGTIGYFEALPDEYEPVKQLFDNCEKYLYQKGAHSVWSPQNGNIMYGVGLAADAFDSEPLFMMPYSPPYYQKYFLRSGYKKFKDLIAFTIDLIDLKVQRKINYIKHRALQSPVKIRPIDLKDYKQEIYRLSHIYSETFKNHWGYVPQSKEETFEMFEPFRMAIDKDFILFAEFQGEIIGFILCVPNFNPVVKQLDGNLGMMNIFNFYRQKRKIRNVRGIAMGVAREHRKQNVAPILIANAFGAMIDKGYTTIEYSWVLKENLASQTVAGKFNGKLYKNYEVYQKLLN